MSENHMAPYKIRNGHSTVSFLESGDIFRFQVEDIGINLYHADPLYGGAGNIWLRLYRNNTCEAYPLIGLRSSSRFSLGQHSARYEGNVDSIQYSLQLILTEDNRWFWQIELEGKTDLEMDILYALDLGLANAGAILTNELYGAQYIDYRSYRIDGSYHLAARQNMAQGGQNPFLQIGLLNTRAVGFETDGLSFYGLDYKSSNEINALSRDLLSGVQQGEFSLLALQSEAFTLSEKKEITVYHSYLRHLETTICEPNNLNDLREQYRQLENARKSETLTEIERPGLIPAFGNPYSSPALSKAEIDVLFPNKRQIESNDGLLSFFTDGHRHVVTAEKEQQTERAHGSIVTTFIDTETVNSNLISSTQYMYGLFNAQVVLGNTTAHKLISANRGFMNIPKTTGQRIYIKLDGQYRLLQMPAIYEMGLNESVWYYRLPNGDLLTVRSFTVADQTDLVLDVTSQKRNAYDFIVTQQLVMGEHEHTRKISVTETGHPSQLQIRTDEISAFYPNLYYTIQVPDHAFESSDDRIFFEDGKARNEDLLTLSLNGTDQFQVVISGYLEGGDPHAPRSYGHETQRLVYEEQYAKLLQGFHLSLDRDITGASAVGEEIDAFNDTAWWYAHNALVHYAVPHGLEQPGGAAWGTRDVSQGPIEFFFAFQQYTLARSVILNIFRHQQEEHGEWPQWFMFDRYPWRADDCHGDVIFWPLKVAADYLRYTADYSILNEALPYQIKDGSPSETESSLLDHIKRAVDVIQTRFLAGTSLISYAGGDWDDTLQPANERARDHMVSSWTQILAYRAVAGLAETLANADEFFAKSLDEMARSIKDDFRRLLLIDGVVSGMVIREDDGSFRPLLHPNDEQTGIHYRLISMTDAILANLLTESEAKQQMGLIQEKLLFPDGAHLMDRPPKYNGGVSKLFMRAEQATYIGRELSSMYVHAHIRYIEALAAMNQAEGAWEAAMQINPMTLGHAVPNAVLRQKNLYFSSSDGEFTDRYDFEDRFNLLRTGDVNVKGGWRLYSSGPGIYLNQVVTRILGLQVGSDFLDIAPTLSGKLNGLVFTMTCFGETIEFIYRKGSNDTAVQNSRQESIGESRQLPYAKTLVRLSKNELLNAGGRIYISL